MEKHLFSTFVLPPSLAQQADPLQRNAVENTLLAFKAIPSALKVCHFDTRSGLGRYDFTVQLPGPDGAATSCTACLQFRLRTLRNQQYGLDLQSLHWEGGSAGPLPIALPGSQSQTSLPQTRLENHVVATSMIGLKPTATKKRKREVPSPDLSGQSTRTADAVLLHSSGSTANPAKRSKAAEPSAPSFPAQAGLLETIRRVNAIPFVADAAAVFSNVSTHLREALSRRDRNRTTIVLVGVAHDSRTCAVTEHAVLTALCEEWPATQDRQLLVEWTPSHFELFKPIRQQYETLLASVQDTGVDTFGMSLFTVQRPEWSRFSLAKEAVVMRHGDYLGYTIRPADVAKDATDYPAMAKPAKRAARDQGMLATLLSSKGGPDEVLAFIVGAGHLEKMMETLRAEDVNLVAIGHVSSVAEPAFLERTPYLLDTPGILILRDRHPLIENSAFDAQAYRAQCDAMLGAQFMATLGRDQEMMTQVSTVRDAARNWHLRTGETPGQTSMADSATQNRHQQLSRDFAAAINAYQRRLDNLGLLFDSAQLSEADRTDATALLGEPYSQISDALEESIDLLFSGDPTSKAAQQTRLQRIDEQVDDLLERIDEISMAGSP